MKMCTVDLKIKRHIVTEFAALWSKNSLIGIQSAFEIKLVY